MPGWWRYAEHLFFLYYIIFKSNQIVNRNINHHDTFAVISVSQRAVFKLTHGAIHFAPPVRLSIKGESLSPQLLAACEGNADPIVKADQASTFIIPLLTKDVCYLIWKHMHLGSRHMLNRSFFLFTPVKGFPNCIHTRPFGPCCSRSISSSFSQHIRVYAANEVFMGGAYCTFTIPESGLNLLSAAIATPANVGIPPIFSAKAVNIERMPFKTS